MRKLALLALLAATACSSVHEAMHIKHAPEPILHLTLLPYGPMAQGKPIPVDVKVNHIKSRLLVRNAELQQQEADTLQLFALDRNFSDFQSIKAPSTRVDGLFHFTFTPRHTGSYRVFAEAQLKNAQLAEFPFADLGGRSLGNFPRAQSLQAAHDGLTFTLTPDDPLVRFNEVDLTMKATDGAGNDVPVSMLELTGFYSDYRTMLHLLPENGQEASFSPDKEGFIKLFIRVSYSGKEATLPFILPIARD